MQLSANDIQILKDYFTDQPVVKAYLFGSYSRNEAELNSDVDILVDLDYSKHIGLGFVKMQTDLAQKLKKRLIWFHPKAYPNSLNHLSKRIKFLSMKGKLGDRQRLLHILEAIEEIQIILQTQLLKIFLLIQ